MDVFGGIEAGGTKILCVVGTGPDDIRASARFDTGDPPATLGQAVRFLRTAMDEGVDLRAIGVASFGPLELRRGHPRYGQIIATPKAGWSGVDVVTPISKAFGLPVGLDTDVNGAALAEGRWGAARGLSTFVYLTVGTGIGGGAVVGGRVVRGLPHPEMGHVFVPRHPDDIFPGSCPFHGDCFEGMASGPAMARRWGRRAEELTGSELERAVQIEAFYVAAGLRTIVYTLAPERIVIGGGVSALPGLLPSIRSRLLGFIAGYPALEEHGAADFVAPAALGGMAGPAGALILAELAARGD